MRPLCTDALAICTKARICCWPSYAGEFVEDWCDVVRNVCLRTLWSTWFSWISSFFRNFLWFTAYCHLIIASSFAGRKSIIVYSLTATSSPRCNNGLGSTCSECSQPSGQEMLIPPNGPATGIDLPRTQCSLSIWNSPGLPETFCDTWCFRIAL